MATSVKIQGLVIKYEGDADGAQSLLRSLGGLLGVAIPTAEASPEPTEDPQPQPLVVPKPDPSACKVPCVAKRITRQVKQKPTRSTKPVYPAGKAKAAEPEADDAGDDENDGDRFAPRNAELQEAIVDYVRLHGPTRVRDLAVALQRAGQAIGKAVSMSPVLLKDDEGLVNALNDEE